ncbi:MAG: DtxR family transcriptional regulator [Deltaproteobacteria bacterium]|nr:DtxR family transcriptional regulator [Deltaproteobacteria bacterium]
MSPALEDYLETIYLLVQEHGFARVKDIARARDVKAATVSIALRKLAELELVRYERREYIALSPHGEEAGRRVFTRHRLLARFFEEVLGMPAAAASEQACAMEHSLTDDAMNRLVRFFEFVGSCPNVVDSFRECQTALGPGCSPEQRNTSGACALCSEKEEDPQMSLADLKPGQSAVVTHVGAAGALRQRLLDMGILPNTTINLERSGPGGEPLWIRCHGARLALRRTEATVIRVRDEMA